MTELPIPYGPEEVTPEWLTQALRSTESIGDCEVLDLEVEPVGEGLGITGNIARLTPRYSNQDDHNLPTLIAKFPSSDPERRARAGRSGFYERKPKFYSEVAAEVNLRTPRSYYSDLSPNNIDHVMLMEDLSHGRAGNSVEGCSETEAERAIDQLARFHAQWWNSVFLEGNSWLPSPFREGLPPGARAAYQERCHTFLKRFESSIPGEIAEAVPELDRILQASAPRLSGPQSTMVHGDYQLNNLIFDLPGNGPAIAVIDWQLVSKGRGVLDLVMFLHSYGDTNQRREVESGLLNLYHSTLLDSGVEDYGIDQCLSDYSVAVAWRLARSVLVMGLSDATRDAPRFRTKLDRTCKSVIEWNVLDKLRA